MNAETDPKLAPVMEAIPHRSHMLLVDEIVSKDDSSILCKKTFRAEEFFFQGHYPDSPIVPGVILCECAVQAGAILLSGIISQDDKVPVLTKLENVRFKNMVQPNQTVELHARLDEVLSNAYFMSAQVKCDGKTAVRFSFVCTVATPPTQK